MASNTEYLPDEITYGFVADRVLLAVGDTNSDDDRYPDGVPAQGTVRFSPQRTILYTQQRPATVLPQDIECTIYHRDHPVALENGYEPELVGKLVDPAGHVGNVALIVGWYDVVYRLSTGTAQRFRFQVKPEHTNDDPLWLPEVAPLQPTPSERFVVNEQIYNDTKEARDDAEQYRDETVWYRDETITASQAATTAAGEAQQYRDTASDHATNAASILADVQDLGITVDTSVGTRVFVGDTMIHGDTGRRDIRDSSINPDDISPGGRAWIQRTGNRVHISLYDISLANAGTIRIADVPAGFRPINREGYIVSISGTEQLEIIVLGGSIYIYNVPGSLGRIRATLSWSTENAWPTALPGVPS